MEIKLNEINPQEMIQVLTEEESIEELVYAKVISNEGNKLYVSYLNPTSKIYKGACVYSFESKVEIVELESISEHHIGVRDVTELGILKLDSDINMYVIENEIEDEELDSDIEDMSDSDSDVSENSFIAEEDPEQWELPDDYREVDFNWSNWIPSTVGEQHFKDTIDKLETYAKIHLDNLKMDKKSV